MGLMISPGGKEGEIVEKWSQWAISDQVVESFIKISNRLFLN